MTQDNENPEEDEDELEETSEDEDELEETSELEEEVLDKNNFNENFSQNFSFSKSVPVLNQVEVAPQIIGLEQGVADEPNHKPIKENNSSNYNLGNQSEEETKYTENSAHIAFEPTKINENNLGRGNVSMERKIDQNAFFTSDLKDNNFSENTEKYLAPERVDEQKLGRESPFDAKPKKYDPNLPKAA